MYRIINEKSEFEKKMDRLRAEEAKHPTLGVYTAPDKEKQKGVVRKLPF
jgi:hypothetical protein